MSIAIESASHKSLKCQRGQNAQRQQLPVTSQFKCEALTTIQTSPHGSILPSLSFTCLCSSTHPSPSQRNGVGLLKFSSGPRLSSGLSTYVNRTNPPWSWPDAAAQTTTESDSIPLLRHLLSNNLHSSSGRDDQNRDILNAVLHASPPAHSLASVFLFLSRFLWTILVIFLFLLIVCECSKFFTHKAAGSGPRNHVRRGKRKTGNAGRPPACVVAFKLNSTVVGWKSSRRGTKRVKLGYGIAAKTKGALRNWAGMDSAIVRLKKQSVAPCRDKKESQRRCLRRTVNTESNCWESGMNYSPGAAGRPLGSFREMWKKKQTSCSAGSILGNGFSVVYFGGTHCFIMLTERRHKPDWGEGAVKIPWQNKIPQIKQVFQWEERLIPALRFGFKTNIIRGCWHLNHLLYYLILCAHSLINTMGFFFFTS